MQTSILVTDYIDPLPCELGALARKAELRELRRLTTWKWAQQLKIIAPAASLFGKIRDIALIVSAWIGFMGAIFYPAVLLAGIPAILVVLLAGAAANHGPQLTCAECALKASDAKPGDRTAKPSARCFLVAARQHANRANA